MTEARTQRADRLRPDDRIVRNGRRYRVQLVRHVPGDRTRGTAAHIEIEASPEEHDGAALVISFEPDREIRLAPRDREAPSRATAAAGVAIVCLLAIAASSGASLAGTMVRLAAPELSSRVVTPCRPQGGLEHADDRVGPPACRLDVARSSHHRVMWRT